MILLVVDARRERTNGQETGEKVDAMIRFRVASRQAKTVKGNY